MKAFPTSPDFLRIARRVVWFEPPETPLSEPVRFMAYAMAHALPEDMAVILDHVGQVGLREAVENAPPGIIDARSWAYWNLMADIEPALPMPLRHLPD